MLMTEQEIVTLIHSEQPGAQKRWLRERNIPFAEGIDGRPSVDYEVVRHVLGWNINHANKRRREPNFKNI